MDYLIAYDLGTGGCKASIFDIDGVSRASAFESYQTRYPHAGWHEQKPADWWKAIIESTKRVAAESAIDTKDISCISISGHSLGVVPLDEHGNVLREYTPIWSDTRAKGQADEYFEKNDFESWYLATGNGFPPQCYPLFKLLWYRDNEPEMLEKTAVVIGTKDYINYKLTGTLATDYSYASGSGAYLLKQWKYSDDFIRAAGLSPDLFPEIVPSTEVVGTLTGEAAGLLGLPSGIRVVSGGVDNACMAAGAGNITDGQCYTSLGSSSWIAVTSKEPLVDPISRPYVFTHLVPGMFASAVSIFSAGSTLNWVRNTLCGGLRYEADEKGADIWALVNEKAASAPIGAHKLVFNPSLGGGTPQEPGPNIKGSFSGLDLRHTQSDILRSTFEGITMNLKLVLDILTRIYPAGDEMMIVGGGAKSGLWRQIFADVFGMTILKSSVDQDAGSLGAAAAGAVGIGMWPDFSVIRKAHTIEDRRAPVPENAEKYRRLISVFRRHRKDQAAFGDELDRLDLD